MSEQSLMSHLIQTGHFRVKPFETIDCTGTDKNNNK